MAFYFSLFEKLIYIILAMRCQVLFRLITPLCAAVLSFHFLIKFFCAVFVVQNFIRQIGC